MNNTNTQKQAFTHHSDAELQAVTTASKFYLNAATQKIKPAQLDRLAQARRAAVQRSVNKPVLANRDGTLSLGALSGMMSDWKFWGMGLLVMSGVAYYGYLQYDVSERANRNADIDDVILSGEAPMDAYFDKGFKLFLQQKGQGLE